MRIILKNEYGEFEMGGRKSSAHIIAASGFGIAGKEAKTVTFEGQAGRTTTNIRDIERTITLSIEFNGGRREIERLYNIIYYPVDILCYFGEGQRRKIRGRILNSTDPESIIYRRLQTAVLQFSCDDPYFHDIHNTVIKIATPVDKLPNLLEDGAWYVSLPAVATETEKTVSVKNRGNTVLYPVIRLYSHKTADDSPENYGITVTNSTTGKAITLEYNLSVGEIITIDLPERKVISNIGGNITHCISDDTVLSEFFLQIGENLVTVDSINASDRVSAEIEFTNNYVAAVI